MMKKVMALSLFIAAGFTSFAQTKKPNYKEAISRFKEFYNQSNADSLYGMFSDQMKSALNLSKTNDMLKSLHQQVGNLNATKLEKENAEQAIYHSVFEKAELNVQISLDEKNKLAGLFFLPVQQNVAAAKELSKFTSDYNVKTRTGETIYGTLTLPEQRKGKPNVVLFIAGSGPTDRDGNSSGGVGSFAFKMLADSLRKAGIASVRFDKRGIAESAAAAKNESGLLFEHYINDVVDYVKKIKDDGSFSKIFIMGHSEGSLIGIAAANKEKVDGLISAAGAGEPANVILSKQIKTNLPKESASADSIMNEIIKGNDVDFTNNYLYNIFRKPVQPYLRSWFAYNPQIEIKKLNIPVLILQGKEDLQVSEQDALLLHKAQPKSVLVIIPKMNHVLKDAGSTREENVKTYTDPTLSLNNEFSKQVIDFCR